MATRHRHAGRVEALHLGHDSRGNHLVRVRVRVRVGVGARVRVRVGVSGRVRARVRVWVWVRDRVGPPFAQRTPKALLPCRLALGLGLGGRVRG